MSNEVTDLLSEKIARKVDQMVASIVDASAELPEEIAVEQYEDNDVLHELVRAGVDYECCVTIDQLYRAVLLRRADD